MDPAEAMVRRQRMRRGARAIQANTGCKYAAALQHVRAGAIVDALGTGQLAFTAADLEAITGIPAFTCKAVLAYLLKMGRVRKSAAGHRDGDTDQGQLWEAVPVEVEAEVSCAGS